MSAFASVGVVGLGLIGGSLARAAKERLGARVFGFDADEGARAAAARSDIFEAVGGEIESVADCRLIAVATPVRAVSPLLREIAQRVAADATIIDCGSAKAEIAAAARALPPACRGRFVPCHPLAGNENSGFAASSADLFAGRAAIVCGGDSDLDAAESARAFWRGIGARVVDMPLAEHDPIFAAVSHLPHLLAFALVDCLGARPDRDRLLEFAAGGFRDFTRIAGSHPAMWRDIFLANRAPLLDALAAYRETLARFEDALRDCESEPRRGGDALFARFAAARALRRGWRAALEKDAP